MQKQQIIPDNIFMLYSTDNT